MAAARKYRSVFSGSTGLMETDKKKIALLGATGSIGTSTLEIIREQSDSFQIVLATAHKDHPKLLQIAREFCIPIIVLTGIADPSQKAQIKSLYPAQNLYFGEDELIRILSEADYDIALNAISGSAGLRSTMSILGRGKDLALANKESLVMAGHLVKELRAFTGARILPVDSEHSAIFQCIGNHPASEIRYIHITASGGPFFRLPPQDFPKITVAQALKHPNWDMGAKVTLDSATMFNKALEVIEAFWLFDLPYDQIKALIHPQSVIHSMVEFIDGSIIAQMSVPDMKLPILYALSYPQRSESKAVQTDLIRLNELSFHEISAERFPLFYLGLEAGRRGGIIPTVMNAANEAAQKLFIEGKIAFCDIFRVVEKAVLSYPNEAHPSLERIIAVNSEVYRRIGEASF